MSVLRDLATLDLQLVALLVDGFPLNLQPITGRSDLLIELCHRPILRRLLLHRRGGQVGNQWIVRTTARRRHDEQAEHGNHPRSVGLFHGLSNI